MVVLILTRAPKTVLKTDFLQKKPLIQPKKIKRLYLDTNLNLLSISKMKNKTNHLCLKMFLILLGNINVNPGNVNRHQKKIDLKTRK